MLKIQNITCEELEHPLGIDILSPRFNWQIMSDQRNVKQTAYQIQVASSLYNFTQKIIWDTGKINSDQSLYLTYQGPPLVSRTQYFYRIQIWDNLDNCTGWSDIHSWEMGFLRGDEWKADWITPPFKEIKKQAKPVYYFRKKFIGKSNIKHARIYASALGLYELFVNGNRVGDELFTPGFTDYHHHIQYQTFDITNQLKRGDNLIGVTLGEGWYRGRFQLNRRNSWGIKGAIIVQLHITYEDGTEQIINTDETWNVSTGPILMSDIYDGEIYDARLEVPWLDASFDDSNWSSSVKYHKYPRNRLCASLGEKVKRIETINPKKIITSPKGETIIDFGQNMVGWIKLKIKGHPGQKIVIDHAEILDKDDNFYRDNMRTAKTQLVYICKSEEEEIFEPHFTFYGFRYIRITPNEAIRLENFIGIVIHSTMKPIGRFECSDPLINQLQHNIQWGQKGNFLDIPTDCPQRDERLGWTGDAQVFARTANFNMDTGRFFTKWLKDLRFSHAFNGALPFWIPSSFKLPLSSSGWGDVATIVPWMLYLTYGDKRILEWQFESMRKWCNYERRNASRIKLKDLFKSVEFKKIQRYIWDSGFHFGDWLAPGEIQKQWMAKKPWIATAYYAYSTLIMAKTALVLGKTQDAQNYQKLYTQICHAFTQRFVESDGKITNGFQSAYVLALEFGLLPSELQLKAAQYLVKDIQAHENHLTTGFLGTPQLCFALSNYGQLDSAYDLLFQTTCPSWLYPITKGATTIWERWDGINPDGIVNLSQVGSDNMVSFNHYAFGAIGDWLYRVVGGLDTFENAPGYKKIIIKPQPGKQLTYSKVELESRYGSIKSSWERKNGNMEFNFTFPPNTTAEIHLPHARIGEIYVFDTLLSNTKECRDVQQKGSEVIFEIGSGQYHFKYQWRD